MFNFTGTFTNKEINFYDQHLTFAKKNFQERFQVDPEKL